MTITTERSRVIKHVSGDFFTGAYRMTGRMSVGASGAIGVLNDTNRSFAVLDDVYISYVHTPGSILAHFAQVRISKTGLEALVLTKREEVGPVGVARGGYARLAQYQVLITTDAFEIRGTLEQPGKYDPDNVLFQGTARFFPIYNATTNACIKPDAKYAGEAVLINRGRVSAFCGGE